MPKAAQEHAASSRDNLLDAAERHFASRGYAAVTLKDIAQDLGIRQPSIYYHVPGGKEDLYVEVMIRHLERHRAGVEAAIAGSGRSLENQLFGVGAWMLRRPPVDVVRMTHADLPALPPDYGKLLESAFQRCVFHPIEAIFQDAAAKGILRFQDIRVLTRIFFSNMAALASARKYWSRHSSEQEVLSGCLDILLRGMLRGGRE
jgi:AcrR family transcriptional regulator